MTERTINAERVEQLIDVFGSFDENVRRIEDAFGVKITNRNNELKVTGDEEAADKGCRAIEALLALSPRVRRSTNRRCAISSISSTPETRIRSANGQGRRLRDGQGAAVKAKTIGQQNYLKAIEKNTITIGVGPAGTGQDVSGRGGGSRGVPRKNRQPHYSDAARREAGERLGFLPGDLQNKVDPYLRPLYDALLICWVLETYGKCLERGNIEVAPAGLYARADAGRQLYHS